MSIKEIEKMIEQLIIKNKEITNRLDILIERTNESFCTAKNLELVAAKIIKEVKNETIIVSKETSLATFPPDGKYSYPNSKVGNSDLGSSGNPEALLWPTKSKSSKLKLLE